MTITDVKPRRKSLVALYIDGEFAVNVDKETFLISRYKVGSQITDEEFYDLTRKSENKRAKEKAFYLIEHRDHSSKELFDKIKKSTNEESAYLAVEKLKDLELINDAAFAKRYAYELFNRKKFAAKRVKYELIKKGIDKEIVNEIIEDVEIDPKEQILELLLGKYKNAMYDEKRLKRAIAALQRYGYNWEDIRSVLEDLKSNFDNDL